MDSELMVEIFDDGADPEDLEIAAQSLRQELLELDVDSVRPATAGPAPEGTKAVDIAAVGALIVGFAGNIELVHQVVSTVKNWLKRTPPAGPKRTLRLTLNGQTLELDAATAEQQQALVDEFVKASAAAR